MKQDLLPFDNPPLKQEENVLIRRQSGRIRNIILGHRLNVNEILCESPLEEPIFKRRRGRPAKLSGPSACKSAQKTPPGSLSRNKAYSIWNHTNQIPDPDLESSKGTSEGFHLHETTAVTKYCKQETTYFYETYCQSIAPSLLHMATEFNDTEEGDSGENVEMVQVGSYKVSSKVSDTLQTILDQKGDIAKYCELEASDSKLSAALESICNVVQVIQTTKFSNLRRKHLDDFSSVVAHAENMNLNIKWLHDRVDEIPRLVGLISKYNEIKGENERNMQVVDAFKKSLETKKDELNEIQLAIQDLEGKMESGTLKSRKLKQELNDTGYRFKQIYDACLKDGKLNIF